MCLSETDPGLQIIACFAVRMDIVRSRDVNVCLHARGVFRAMLDHPYLNTYC